jgi:heat-inducible transcriptional repressor
LDRGLSVAIGAEHGFEPLASCALVVSPVTVGGEVAGTIGVLGPTRMNYPKALAAVRIVGEQLGARLARRGGD